MAAIAFRELQLVIPMLRKEFQDAPAGTSLGSVVRRLIVRIDQEISRRVNAVLACPEFVRLESAWRGIEYLVSCCPVHSRTKLALCPISWRKFLEDVDRVDVDKSHFYRIVFLEAADQLGGIPYTAVIADYAFFEREFDGVYLDDGPADHAAAVLPSIAATCSKALTLFIAGASPDLLGLDRGLAQLQSPVDVVDPIGKLKSGTGLYRRWQSFRRKESSRFVALAMPRFLLRSPYIGGFITTNPALGTGFVYSGQEESATTSWIWGNGAYGVGAVIARSFSRTGWFRELRGVLESEGETAELMGGVLPMTVSPSLHESNGGFLKPPIELCLRTDIEERLVSAGIIPICALPPSSTLAFFGMPTVHDPESTSGDAPQIASARLSASVPHMLTANRIGHELRRYCEINTGSNKSPEQMESEIRTWLGGRTSTNASDTKPLLDASAKLSFTQDDGVYKCQIELVPHMRPERSQSKLHLSFEIRGSSAAST